MSRHNLYKWVSFRSAPTLQAELVRRYPKLFRKSEKRLVDPDVIGELEGRLLDDWAPFDERGIECGDGWFELVDRLCRACENEIELMMAQGIPQQGWPLLPRSRRKWAACGSMCAAR